eukprot:366147-Chlamydomonas_euryale.AAC.17
MATSAPKVWIAMPATRVGNATTKTRVRMAASVSQGSSCSLGIMLLCTFGRRVAQRLAKARPH